MKLSKINDSAPAEIRFLWQDEEIEASYYPGRITPAWSAKLSTNAPLSETLAEVMAGWDIVDDDNQPCAPALTLPRIEYVAAWRDLLMETNNTFQRTIVNAIIDDFTQAPPQETASTPGS